VRPRKPGQVVDRGDIGERWQLSSENVIHRSQPWEQIDVHMLDATPGPALSGYAVLGREEEVVRAAGNSSDTFAYRPILVDGIAWHRREAWDMRSADQEYMARQERPERWDYDKAAGFLEQDVVDRAVGSPLSEQIAKGAGIGAPVGARISHAQILVPTSWRTGHGPPRPAGV
jgi:hypothetical protein